MVFEKPVAHIDRQVDLLALYDFEFALVLLHIDGHEFVADLWRMLCSVYEAELVLFKLIELFGLGLLITLPSLLPSNFVETLSKEDDEGQHCAIEGIVDLLAHCV